MMQNGAEDLAPTVLAERPETLLNPPRTYGLLSKGVK